MLTFTQLGITFLSGFLLLVIVLYLTGHIHSGNLPYPPGPKRLPIIGNLLDMPSREEWITYRKWSDEYGSDVVHVDVVGTHAIILNSIEAGNELFIKRSSIYSDRPRLPAVTRIFRMGWLIAFASNNTRWRSVRRAFHRHLGSTEIKGYYPLEQHAIRCLLRDLLESPENFSQHLRHMTGKIILGIAYGIEVLSQNDPYVAIVEKMLHAVSLATQSSGRLFSMIPWLLYLPSWFPGPGAGFKREAQKWLPIVANTINEPYAVVQSALADGTAKYSVASDMTAHLNENSTAEDVLLAKIVPANMFVGGADTTVSALLTFFMAMALYPEVQRTAQAEIDAVLGGSRLPEFSDKAELPYVNAIVKEVFRWHPVGPLGVEHRVTQDDVYKGYFIPAGSTVIGNVWAMMYDPIVFPDPNIFLPERWLAHGAPAFPDLAFGFGRRECPGRFLAETSVWAAIANVLAVFRISPVEGDPPKRVYTSGVVSYPEPFKCLILPRSEVAAELVRATVNEPQVE